MGNHAKDVCTLNLFARKRCLHAKDVRTLNLFGCLHAKDVCTLSMFESYAHSTCLGEIVDRGQENLDWAALSSVMWRCLLWILIAAPTVSGPIASKSIA